jgi:hypothetical protein
MLSLCIVYYMPVHTVIQRWDTRHWGVGSGGGVGI